MSVNRVTLIGNVGGDPTTRFFEDSNGCVSNFSLATNRQYTDRSGKPVEVTEWHRIVAWGKTAEMVDKYVRKGRMLYVEGELRYREYTDKNQNLVRTAEVFAQRIMFLAKHNATSEPYEAVPPQEGSSIVSESLPDTNDGLPF